MAGLYHSTGFFQSRFCCHNARHTHLSEDRLMIHQTLIDPDDLNDWSRHLTLDPEKSNEAPPPSSTSNPSRRFNQNLFLEVI